MKWLLFFLQKKTLSFVRGELSNQTETSKCLVACALKATMRRQTVSDRIKWELPALLMDAFSPHMSFPYRRKVGDIWKHCRMWGNEIWKQLLKLMGKKLFNHISAIAAKTTYFTLTDGPYATAATDTLGKLLSILHCHWYWCFVCVRNLITDGLCTCFFLLCIEVMRNVYPFFACLIFIMWVLVSFSELLKLFHSSVLPETVFSFSPPVNHILFILSLVWYIETPAHL